MNKYKCPTCGSTNTIKAGIDWRARKQKVLCKACTHIFQGASIDEKKPADSVKSMQVQNQPSAKIGDSHDE